MGHPRKLTSRSGSQPIKPSSFLRTGSNNANNDGRGLDNALHLGVSVLFLSSTTSTTASTASTASTTTPSTALPDSVIEEDEDGNLPIHVAALGDFTSTHMTWRKPTHENWGDFEPTGGTAESTIAILLEANVASPRCRNRQGKFPLQLAIESGRDWQHGIGALADAFPDVIGDEDKETGLDSYTPIKRVYRQPS
jgi:ankyrin repeat protein